MYLDTHAVVWLYAGEVRRFPSAARRHLEREPLLISPAVVLKVEFLFEIGRVTDPAATMISALAADVDLGVCDLPFAKVVAEACSFTWTRDPFDRLIVAQAMLGGALLLTKDETILAHCARATWA